MSGSFSFFIFIFIFLLGGGGGGWVPLIWLERMACKIESLINFFLRVILNEVTKKVPNQFDILNICWFSFQIVLEIKQGYNRNISKFMTSNFRNMTIFWDIPKWNGGQINWNGGSILLNKKKKVLLCTQSACDESSYIIILFVL